MDSCPVEIFTTTGLQAPVECPVVIYAKSDFGSGAGLTLMRTSAGTTTPIATAFDVAVLVNGLCGVIAIAARGRARDVDGPKNKNGHPEG
ncbi:MAG TPA: hypothetical protein VGM90_19530 [Kofleriaceae bacterium]|jgi:hypothetical protein